MPEPLTLPLLLTARMAHLTATEQRVRVLQGGSFPYRVTKRPDGGHDMQIAYPDNIRAMLDDLDAISREYVAGCANLAKPEASALEYAVGHFRRTVELVEAYTAKHAATTEGA
jgi:hypothetical protein